MAVQKIRWEILLLLGGEKNNSKKTMVNTQLEKHQELQNCLEVTSGASSGAGNSCDSALASVHQLLVREPARERWPQVFPTEETQPSVVSPESRALTRW